MDHKVIHLITPRALQGDEVYLYFSPQQAACNGCIRWDEIPVTQVDRNLIERHGTPDFHLIGIGSRCTQPLPKRTSLELAFEAWQIALAGLREHATGQTKLPESPDRTNFERLCHETIEKLTHEFPRVEKEIPRSKSEKLF